MNYEQKYKEALEKARQFSEHPLQEDSSSIVEYIFPELKESEDEKIRKELLEYANDRYAAVKNNATKPGTNKIHIDWWGKAIAWLEKQGEKKPIEVKEVDLDKEIELIKGDYEQVYVAWNNDFDFIARHFFELGLKTQKGE